MGAQALRWDFSGGFGSSGAGGESLFGNDFEEVAASAAATSATASWLPPGASLRASPEGTASCVVSSASAGPSGAQGTTGTGGASAKGKTGKARKGKGGGGKKRHERGKAAGQGGSAGKGKGKGKGGQGKAYRGFPSTSGATFAKSPTWDPSQIYTAPYEGASPQVGEGESSMQDMSLSLLKGEGGACPRRCHQGTPRTRRRRGSPAWRRGRCHTL